MGKNATYATSVNDAESSVLAERGIQKEFEDVMSKQVPVSYPSPHRQPKNFVFSFFSGCGFLDLGFEKTGYDVVMANELSPEFTEAHHFSRNRMGIRLPTEGYHQGSIAELLGGVKEEWLANLMRDYRKKGTIGFIGGPPCPDFSVGGKNKGREGERGQLTKSYFELIMKQKPDWFLFENVKGLWRTKKHREFYEEMKRMAMDNGYSVSEKLINSIEYGAPQDRDRIIMLGFRGKMVGSQNGIRGTMLSEDDFSWQEYITAERSQVFEHAWPKQNKFGAEIDKPDVPLELTVMHWFDKNDVLNHPNAVHCFVPRQGLARFKTVNEGDDSRKSYKRLHRYRYSPTACYGNNEVHLHPTLPRRISVAEALALQSLPKEFILPPGMTLSAMFKTIGNGVPFLAAKGLAEMIRDFIDNKP
jgi:DNA (cytosine-5)-methyltransferase 1